MGLVVVNDYRLPVEDDENILSTDTGDGYIAL